MRSFILAISLTTSPSAFAAPSLLSCVQRNIDHGYSLELEANADGLPQATLSLTSFRDSRVVSTLTHCTQSAAGTPLPFGVTACNNTIWNDRWNVSFAVGAPADALKVVATLKHNEVKVATLICQAPESDELTVDGPAATSLIKALRATTIAPTPVAGGFRIAASHVDCTHTPQGFIWAQCRVRDQHGATGFGLLTGKAFALLNALDGAGVPVTVDGGDSSIKVRQIACVSQGGDADSCVITL